MTTPAPAAPTAVAQAPAAGVQPTFANYLSNQHRADRIAMADGRASALAQLAVSNANNQTVAKANGAQAQQIASLEAQVASLTAQLAAADEKLKAAATASASALAAPEVAAPAAAVPSAAA